MIPIFKLERERSKERDTDGRRTERQRKRLYDVAQTSGEESGL